MCDVTGEAEQRTVMASDGSVSMVAPWGHTVSTDTVPYSVLAEPDPVLAESYPVPGKQRTEIGGDLANRFEWRYFLRRAPGAKPRTQGNPATTSQLSNSLIFTNLSIIFIVLL